MGTDHVLHLVGDVESESRSGASSSPSDVTEGRLVDDHAIHSIKQIIDSFFSPGRKELERENHTVVRQPIVDLVDNLHACLLLLLLLLHVVVVLLSGPSFFRFLP